MTFSLPRRQPQIVAQVVAARTVTPHMRRLTLGGPTLHTLLSTDGIDAPAAWVKIFPPGREGRAYTVRHVDRAAGTLDIDFVLHGDERHDDGSVSAWARQAAIGAGLGIAGPRHGGFALQADARWLWLAADASALPAIQRILETLPADLDVHVLALVGDARERQPLPTRARLQETWLYADAPGADIDALLADVFDRARRLGHDGQVWIAGESGLVRHWRSLWSPLTPAQLSAKGYWKHGERDHRDREG